MWIELSHLESPLGSIVLAVSEEGLCALDFTDSESRVQSRLERTHADASFRRGARAKEMAQRVKAYFGGELRALEDIPVAAAGTVFQKEVWRALRKIPVGQTASYREIAQSIGKPAAVRAVGAANGQNPAAIVVPCHRVVASNGALWGYGGGLWRKEWLLRHEGALPQQPLSAIARTGVRLAT